MRTLAAAILLTAISTPFAAAQARPSYLEPFVPRYTASIGYAKVRANAPPGGCDCFGTDGGYANLAVTVMGSLRIAGEVIGSHADNIGPLGQNLTLLTYTAGPQLAASTHRADIFGQAMFGVAHGSDSYFPSGNTATTSASSFAFSTGGGLDVRLTQHVGIRVAHVQYLRTALPNNSTNVQNHLALSAGIVLRMHRVSTQEDKDRQRAYRQMNAPQPKVASIAPVSTIAVPVTISRTTAGADFTGHAVTFDTATRSAFFDYDSYDIRPDAQTAIEADAAYLKVHPELQVVVAGYADERGTAEYDLALGEKRAQAVRDQLISHGVSPQQLDVISYGKERPLCTTEDEACFQQNRRAALELHP